MRRQQLPRFHELADLPGNHVLNACRGWLSVVRPYARTNLVTNPSLETATTNYTAVGGSIARTTAEQYHGAYSLAVTPSAGTNSDGVFYGTVSLTSGTTYAYSCKCKGAAGRQYTIAIATTGGVNLTAYTFTATGKWQWVWGFWTETSSTSRRFYIRKNAHSDGSVFYVDGLQIEACGSEGVFVTTYIDGDQQSLLAQTSFPPPYGWTGTRHASTSYRSAQTRDGGRVLNFDRFLLLVTAIAGLGLAPPDHVAARPGTADGATYATTYVGERTIAVSTRWNSRSNVQLKQLRKELGAAIALDATEQRQPLALLYQEYDGLRPLGDTGKIIASYADGLAGQWDNLVGESPTITFTQWLPFIAGPDSGASLSQSNNVTITDVSTLMVRSEAGVWSQAGANAGTAGVTDIAIHPDGTIYLVGDFTTIGGTAANRVARYDPATGTFSALSTGLSGSGQRVRIGPNGDVFVAGTFVTAGGVTVNNVARWDGAAWNAMGSGGTKGVDNTVLGMTLDIDGNVYVSGQFLNAGGAGAVRIAKWTASSNAWSALGTGLNGNGVGLATGLDSNIYVAGTFTTANGVAAVNLAYWNGTTFVAMGSGLAGGSANDLITAPDGTIYLAGQFSSVNGLSANNVARWNGSQWQPLGTGVGGVVGSVVSRLAFAPDGLLYAAGAFTTVNSQTTTIGLAIWNGSSWVLPDLTMPAPVLVNVVGVAISLKGEIYIGTNNGMAGTATAAATATLTNDGTALAYPTFYITGPSSGSARLYQIRNVSSGQTISFNLSINALEQIAIRILPGSITVTSSFRGTINGAVVRGSAADLPLLRGANTIAFYAPGSTITITAVWAKGYADAADLSY